jgi:hypothetical protein
MRVSRTGGFAERVESGTAGDERDRNVERRAELRRVVVRRALLRGERLPQALYVPFGGFAEHVGDVLRAEPALCRCSAQSMYGWFIVPVA